MKLFEANAFSISRTDQLELWQFVAPLLASDEDLKLLWGFANSRPGERVMLLNALQANADIRGVDLVRLAQKRK
jgi:hypothetical protein